MGILNLGGSDEFEEFDEYEYEEFSEYEELDDEGAATGSGSKRLVAMVLAGLLAVVGTTFGAKLLINTGNGIEYGQGFKTVVSCQNQSLTVTPYAGFINQANGGVFTLDSIYIEGLTDNCKNVDFIVRVYANVDSAALTVSESATSTSTYKTYDAARFYYQDSGTVTTMSNAYIDIENATDTSTGTTDTSGSLQITFDPDTVASFAKATDVYKITIETAIHNATKD